MSKKAKPLVSIIIPSFNRGRLFYLCLQSILKQNYKEWECLIIDDGSDLFDLDFIQATAAIDPRFVFHARNTSPQGASACRNIGLKRAKGDFILFLDSDDVLAPWALENRIQEFKAHPTMDFMVHPQLIFNTVIGDSNELWSLPDNHTNSLEHFLKLGSPWPISGPIWKRTFLEKHQLRFDEYSKNWQDCEFHAKCLLATKQFRWSSSTIPDGFIRISDHVQISSKPLDPQYLIARMESHRTFSENLTKLESLNTLFSQSIVQYLISIFNRLVIYKQSNYSLQSLRQLISIAPLNKQQKQRLKIYLFLIQVLSAIKANKLFSKVSGIAAKKLNYSRFRGNSIHNKSLSSDELNNIRSSMIWFD